MFSIVLAIGWKAIKEYELVFIREIVLNVCAFCL